MPFLRLFIQQVDKVRDFLATPENILVKTKASKAVTAIDLPKRFIRGILGFDL